MTQQMRVEKKTILIHWRFVMGGKPTNRLVGHTEVGHAHAQGNMFALPNLFPAI